MAQDRPRDLGDSSRGGRLTLVTPQIRPRMPVAARLPADARWDPLIGALFVYIMIDVGRVHLLFHALAAFHPAIICGLLSIVLCALTRNLSAAGRVLRHPVAYLVCALFLWATLSVPGSLYPGASLGFLIGEFFKTVLMSFVIVIAIRGPRDVERLMYAFLLAAFVYSLVVLSRFQVAPGERLAELYTYDANDLALFLVCAVPFGLHVALRRTTLLRRGIAVAALLAFVGVIIRTGSRGGFIALLVVMLLILLTWRFIGARWRLLGAAVGVVVFLASANTGYWSLMSNLLDVGNDYNVTSVNGRVQVWKRGFGYMTQRPIFGVGLNAFSSAEGHLSEAARNVAPNAGFKWSSPHNLLVQVGAELGIPGLLIFVAFLFQLVRTTARLVRRDQSGRFALAPPAPALGKVLLTSFGGFFVAALFLSQAYGSVLYFLAAMMLGLQRVAVRVVPAPARPLPGRWR